MIGLGTEQAAEKGVIATGQPGAWEGHILERHGKAKPFRSLAQWEQPVRAVVRIKGDKLSAVEEVQWGDVRDLNSM